MRSLSGRQSVSPAPSTTAGVTIGRPDALLLIQRPSSAHDV
jgi:hypothetical protein